MRWYRLIINKIRKISFTLIIIKINISTILCQLITLYSLYTQNIACNLINLIFFKILNNFIWKKSFIYTHIDEVSIVTL